MHKFVGVGIFQNHLCLFLIYEGFPYTFGTVGTTDTVGTACTVGTVGTTGTAGGILSYKVNQCSLGTSFKQWFLLVMWSYHHIVTITHNYQIWARVEPVIHAYETLSFVCQNKHAYCRNCLFASFSTLINCMQP